MGQIPTMAVRFFGTRPAPSPRRELFDEMSSNFLGLLWAVSPWGIKFKGCNSFEVRQRLSKVETCRWSLSWQDR